MMTSMEAARLLKTAASALEAAKRARLEAAVAVADRVEFDPLAPEDLRVAYALAKQAEFTARVAYVDAVEKRWQVVDYVKARAAQPSRRWKESAS